MPTISKIQLPNGNSYEIKDAYARQLIAGGISFVIAWDGKSEPVAAQIPKSIVVTYQNTNTTGTLEPTDAQVGSFYLVYSPTQESQHDQYDEYVTIGTGENRTWEKLGDTRINLSDLKALAYKDSVTLNKGNGDIVLGEGTTFTNSSSAVTFSGNSTQEFIKADAHFTSTAPTVPLNVTKKYITASCSNINLDTNTKQAVTELHPETQSVLGSNTTFQTTVIPTTTNIKATATGAAVGADGTANAITGFGAHSTQTFVKSVEANTTNKLVTTTVPNVTGNTDVSIPNVTGNTNVSIPNVTSVGTASTWSFSLGSDDDAETLIIGGGNSTTPTLGTALSASKVTLGTNLSASKVTLGDAKTVATGSVSTTGTGSAVVIEISSKSDDAITALGTPITSACLTGVKVTTQPSVSLSTGATAGTGVISVATGITSATTGVQTADSVSAITELGDVEENVLSSVSVMNQPDITLSTALTSSTGAVQVAEDATIGTITPGSVSYDSMDKASAITALGTGTAAAQTITVGTNDKIAVAKYNDLSVSVS